MSTQKTFSFHPAIKADENVPGTLDFGSGFVPQVQKMIEAAGPNLMQAEEVTLPGQAVASIIALASLEMLMGLPPTTEWAFGDSGPERTGKLNLSNWRHNMVRPRRSERPEGDKHARVVVIDGAGRGLADYQMAELSEVLDVEFDDIQVFNVCTFGPARDGHIARTQGVKNMVESILDTGLTKADYEQATIVYVPHGMGLAASLQATAIYGLSERWPMVIRTNKGEDNLFHVVEVIDVQAQRQWGARLRGEWDELAKVETVTLPRETLQQMYEVCLKYAPVTIEPNYPTEEEARVNEIILEVQKYLKA